MSDYIGSAEQFTFHADISFDHVLPSGQKLQYAATEDVALRGAAGFTSSGTVTSATASSGTTASRSRS